MSVRTASLSSLSIVVPVSSSSCLTAPRVAVMMLSDGGVVIRGFDAT